MVVAMTLKGLFSESVCCIANFLFDCSLLDTMLSCYVSKMPRCCFLVFFTIPFLRIPLPCYLNCSGWTVSPQSVWVTLTFSVKLIPLTFHLILQQMFLLQIYLNLLYLKFLLVLIIFRDTVLSAYYYVYCLLSSWVMLVWNKQPAKYFPREDECIQDQQRIATEKNG